MKVGVLGFGSIGKRHAENARSLGHQVDVFDPLQQISNRIQVIRESDAVIIASPTKNHVEDLMECLHRDKHVLVEKPIGYDCPKLVEGYLAGTMMRNPNLIVATGYNLRFHQAVKFAKGLLDRNRIGDIQRAWFTVRQKSIKPVYLMDGLIRNWCSHEIDLAFHLLGPAAVTKCQASLDKDGRDTGDAFIYLENPSVREFIKIDADYVSEPERRGFLIESDQGSIQADLVARTITLSYCDGPGEHIHCRDSFDSNYRSEIGAFFDSIKSGKLAEPLASGMDGVRSLEAVMEARQRAGIYD